jgi:hypothetical protein
MKNKILSNINMPKLSKNQKIRNETLKLLESNKGKLDPRTFSALKIRIRDKRIDAVKRILNKLNYVRFIPDNKIVMFDLGKKVEELKSKKADIIQKAFIKRNVIEITEPDARTVYDRIKEMKGSVKVLIVDDGKVIMDTVIDLSIKKNNIYTQLYFMFIADSYDNDIFTEHPNAKVIITQNETLQTNRIAQAFKNGMTNCLFKPIISFMYEKSINSSAKQTKKNYNWKYNKAVKLEKEYFEKGVKEEDLQYICDELQIELQIDLPFQKTILNYRSNVKPLRCFKFVNTKINHVEANHNFNKSSIEVSQEELTKMYNELKNNKTEYFTYTRNLKSISSITTLNNEYIVKQDYQNFINDFEIETGINACKLCDVKNKNISQYVRQGNHFLGTVDLKPMLDDDDVAIEYKNYYHKDMRKAYKNFDKCKYYKGFLGKITDFKKTDKIVDLGYYTIINIQLVGQPKLINDRFKLFKNGNVYPSPVLDWLKDNGCSFDIIEGCWGTNLNFNMNDEEWITKEKIDEYSSVSWYAKYVGSMYHESNTKSFYMINDKEYIQNILSYVDIEHQYYETDDNNGEIRFKYPKGYNNHLSHISGFVLGYTLLNLLEQLMIMDLNDVIRVVVDGIYHYNEYPNMNIFRNEDKEIKQNVGNYTLISNYTIEREWNCEAEYKEHYGKELHTGPGGTGKTTKQCTDKGLIKVLFVAPSWKLARNKKEELGVDCQVWNNILTADPNVWGSIIRNYNVLVIDEVSMMNNYDKELIFERYSTCKIIMCGDIGFQLPGFSTGKNKFEEFKIEGFDNIENHKTNYRVQDKELLFKLNKIRTFMEYDKHYMVKDYVLNNFTKWEKNKPFDYNVKDMILVGTNKEKDIYTEQFKHLEKYYVKNNTKSYSNGQILYEKPNEKGVDYKIRHAYTTHSIQGETAYNNLYIDMTDMRNSKMIYTALSRARFMEQIILIV